MDIERSEDQILASMKPKTRYNISLSTRKGVDVRSVGIEGLEIWYKLYCETAERNKLHVSDFNYFRTVFMEKMGNKDADVQVKLLIAYVDNIPLAAMFLILSSHRATYLYGASTTLMRNFMPTYALQWKAIQIAREHHCTEYDMFGVAPRPEPSHPMYGLYKFKKGFGGNIYHQLGCWDYPLDEEKYKLLQAYEMKLQGYYL